MSDSRSIWGDAPLPAQPGVPDVASEEDDGIPAFLRSQPADVLNEVRLASAKAGVTRPSTDYYRGSECDDCESQDLYHRL